MGKWHLGLGGPHGPDWNKQIAPGPKEIGFDYSFILPTTNDRVPQVFVHDGLVKGLDPKDPLWVGSKIPTPDHPTGISHRSTLRMNWSNGHNQSVHNGIGRIGFYTGGLAARFRDEDLADVWVSQCTELIEAPNKDPFFLLFCSHNVHVPRMVHERFQGKSSMGPRGDAILELDWSVGEILDSLERVGKREDTLIVFCSDNGPVLDDGYVDGAIEQLGNHRPAGPYRGGKYNIFEGGTRTPFIVSWPNGAPSKAVTDEIVSTIDLAASFAHLAGVKLPENGFQDSQNVLEALLAKPKASGRMSLVMQDNGTSGNFGFRSGKWKLLRHKTKNSRNVELRLVNTPVNELMLFDLEADPNEANDLSEVMPDRVGELNASLQKILDAKGERHL